MVSTFQDLIAPAGVETDFIVTRNFISRLEKPYGNCLEDTSINSKFNSSIFNYIVRIEQSTYSQKYCFSLCKQLEIINICNCSLYQLDFFQNTTNFCSEKSHECAEDVIYNFNRSQSLNCENECPFECNSIKYDVSANTFNYPTKSYAENVLLDWVKKDKDQNISLENIYKSFIKVNIYYKSLEYISTNQKIQITTQTLVASIGGYIGLCVGLTILSAIEVLILIIDLFSAIVSYMKNKYSMKRMASI